MKKKSLEYREEHSAILVLSAAVTYSESSKRRVITMPRDIREILSVVCRGIHSFLVLTLQSHVVLQHKDWTQDFIIICNEIVCWLWWEIYITVPIRTAVCSVIVCCPALTKTHQFSWATHALADSHLHLVVLLWFPLYLPILLMAPNPQLGGDRNGRFAVWSATVGLVNTAMWTFTLH